MEQKELHHQRELQRIQDQIRQQQMQLMQAAMSGANPGTSGQQGGASHMNSLLNPANTEMLQRQSRGAKKWPEPVLENWMEIKIHIVYIHSAIVMDISLVFYKYM